MKPKTSKNPESVVREIKRKTRRKFNSEEKIRIILEELRVKTASRLSAVARALPPVYTTNGARRFYRLASAGWTAIHFVKPTATK